MATSALQSKLARAIKALLVAEGAASENDTYFEFSSAERTLPNTTILTGQSDELVKYSGIWKFPNISITFRDNAAVQPDETNPNAAWLAAQARYSLVRDTLSRIGDDGSTMFMRGEITTAGRALATAVDASEEAVQKAADNADMAQFTCTWWKDVDLGALRADAGGTFYEADLIFEAHAANSAF